MPYATGTWGEQAKIRSKKRLKYFKNYTKSKYKRRFNGFGSLGELLALRLLPNSKLVRKKTHDIVWQRIKIEVKISSFRKTNSWNFCTGRQKDKTDYFLFFCMDKSKKVLLRTYFIPNKVILNSLIMAIYPNQDKYAKFRLKGGD